MKRIGSLILGVSVACVLIAASARGAVDSVSENGFALSGTTHVAATPEQVYQAFLTPSHWWSPVHSFSHDAANLTLDAKAGGCWCETLPGGGSVLHMTVVNVVPGQSIRLRGALGPFQSMGVDGAMTVAFKPAGDGTDVNLTYALGGYAKGGFADLSKAGDGVLAEALARLKSFVETGSPETARSVANSR